MPPPFPVVLAPYDAAWADLFSAESEALRGAMGSSIVAVHHIGSTAIPGIRAKPVLDMIPVVRSLVDLDINRPVIEGLGYVWRGEHGLPGRCYCTRADAATGRRLVHAHIYAEGSPEIRRHLAFRDHLRANAGVAAAYDRVKAECRMAHPLDSHAYTDCKSGWIKRIEAEALALRDA